MRIAIAGAHGKIGRLLTARLSGRHTVIGLIRNPDHAADLEADGGQPVVCDLERAERGEIAQLIVGADAVVFAAGAGPGSGAERKLTMDRDGAIKLLGAASDAHVPRYVIVSSVGAEDPPPDDDGHRDAFSVYVRAKAEADAAVRGSSLDWTIVRPGRLTDDPGTGKVRVDTIPHRSEVPRADVAALLDAVLHDPRSAGAILYVNRGEDELPQALARALSAR
jgi:nucleoside-diphosphate-sugar epimerase